MRHDFEAVEITLIEVYPYNRSQKLPSGPRKQDNIYGIESSGWRVSSGVDLLWRHPKIVQGTI